MLNVFTCIVLLVLSSICSMTISYCGLLTIYQAKFLSYYVSPKQGWETYCFSCASICLSVHLTVHPNILGTQLLLQFRGVFLKLCRCFYQGLKMCMTLCSNPKSILSLFCSSDLVILGLKAFRHWVSCECNSSYS